MNKKIYLFAILLSAILFAGCDDVYDHVAAPPQSHEQEAEQSISGFTFALGTPFTSPVVLTEEALEDGTVYEAVRTTATPELAEGATITFKLEASDTNDFLSAVELPSVSNDNAVTITAADLDEAVKSLYGKAPNARDVYLRATYYIVEGTTSSRMPTPAVLGPVSVTPVSPFIETEYYLVGGINGWDIGDLEDYKFDHSGKDVYEDPYFSILLNNLQGEFKIVPKSSKDAASWDGVFGTYEATALEGELQLDGGNLKVEEAGWVKVTLNMMEGTYTIEIIGEMNLTLRVPGGHQGWDPGSAPTLYSRNFDFIYDGYVYFDGVHEYKFTSQANWDGPNYGDGGSEGVLSDDGGAGNLKVEEAGYYRLNVNLSGNPYTYSAVKTEWGLIGDATSGGWDNSTDMTFDPTTGLWTVTTDLDAKSFKFRANNAWTINIGGDLNNLVYDGDNIAVTEAGTYLITLDLTDPVAYKATVTKQ